MPTRTIDEKLAYSGTDTSDPQACWIWQGYRHIRTGYGQIRWGGGTREAYRIVYEQMRGPIPEGMQLDHLCRNRGCVNPDHLEPVTRRENILRGESPSAMHARKTHCKHGHEFTEENTYTWRRQRTCRTCNRQRVAESKARRMERAA